MGSESRRTSIAKYIDAFSGFIGLIVFTNFLGVSGVGIYYILSAISMISATPATGIAKANEHYISSENGNMGEYMSTTILTGIVSTSMISGIIYILHRFLDVFSMFELPEGSIIALMIVTVLTSLHQTGRSGYSGSGYPSSTTFISALRGIFETILQITALVVFGFGVPALLICTAIAAVFSFTIFITRPSVKLSKPEISKLKKLFLYARWSFLTSLFENVYRRVDELMLGVIATPAAAGVYSAAKRLVNPVSIIGFGIKRPMLVSMSQYNSVSEELMSEVSRLGSYASILGIPVIFGGVVIGDSLLEFLYGTEYVEGYLSVVACAVYFSILSHNSVLSDFINGIEQPKDVSVSMVLSTLIKVAIGCSAIYLYGLNGIIPAIIVPAAVRYIYLSYSIKKRTDESYTPSSVAYQILSSIIMLLTIIPVSMVPISTMYSVIFTIFIGGITYALSIVYLDDKLRDIVNSNVKFINI